MGGCCVPSENPQCMCPSSAEQRRGLSAAGGPSQGQPRVALADTEGLWGCGGQGKRKYMDIQGSEQTRSILLKKIFRIF